MVTTPDALAQALRNAFPDYEPAKLAAKEVAYLKSLKLPGEIETFLLSFSPAEIVGTTSQLLSIDGMREEHEEMDPSTTVRKVGASVLATANGNPYFVIRKGKGYEIRIVDHEDISEDDELKDLIASSKAGPVFTSLTEFISALAAQVLPSSPHSSGRERERFEAWRASGGKTTTAASKDAASAKQSKSKAPVEKPAVTAERALEIKNIAKELAEKALARAQSRRTTAGTSKKK
jgi:hypothetical protein